MSERQRSANLGNEGVDATLVPSPSLSHVVRHSAAIDEPKDQIRAPWLAPKVVQRHNVWVLEPAHQLCLDLETSNERRVVRQVLTNHLDRNLTPKSRLHRPVHRAVRALPDLLTKPIAPRRRR